MIRKAQLNQMGKLCGKLETLENILAVSIGDGESDRVIHEAIHAAKNKVIEAIREAESDRESAMTFRA